MSRISSATGGSAAGATKGNDLRDVDLDQFLQLMIAELQNQDPLNPLDNSEILQQISQIREIGATNQLSDTLRNVQIGQNLSTASALIGKEVQALTDGAENIQGLVERVSIEVNNETQSRELRVLVNGERVRLENVREVFSA